MAAGDVEVGSVILEELAADGAGGSSMAVVLGVLDRLGVVPEVGAGRVAQAFDSCAWPSSVLGVEQWVRLFRGEGFTRDWVAAPPPVLSRRLYRGSGPAGVGGMCWSMDVAVARYYALSSSGGVVVSAIVEPGRQLAELGIAWERMVVVDPVWLEFAEVESAEDLVGFSRDALLADLCERADAGGPR